ncbi:wall-associated receptor kinase 2-like [Fagus crenata]
MGMDEANGVFGNGCFSLCANNESNLDSDNGKSKISLLNLTNRSDGSLTGISCMYAFITDPTLFDIPPIDLNIILPPDQYPRPPMVFDWVVGKDKCEASEGPSGYACGLTGTLCSPSHNGGGVRCLCKEGYMGNPYLPQGCQGNYTCCCPVGTHGDGKVACQGVRLTKIVAGIICFSMIKFHVS